MGDLGFCQRLEKYWTLEFHVLNLSDSPGSSQRLLKGSPKGSLGVHTGNIPRGPKTKSVENTISGQTTPRTPMNPYAPLWTPTNVQELPRIPQSDPRSHTHPQFSNLHRSIEPRSTVPHVAAVNEQQRRLRREVEETASGVASNIKGGREGRGVGVRGGQRRWSRGSGEARNVAWIRTHLVKCCACSEFWRGRRGGRFDVGRSQGWRKRRGLSAAKLKAKTGIGGGTVRARYEKKSRLMGRRRGEGLRGERRWTVAGNSNPWQLERKERGG